MPATKTESTVTAPITTSSIDTALKAAMTAAGYSAPYDEFDDGATFSLIYRVIYDAGVAKGTSYLQINYAISSEQLILAQRLHDGWNTTTHENPDFSGSSSVVTFPALSPASNLFLVSLDSPETRFVIFSQGSEFGHIGLVRPANLPAFWENNFLNNCAYAFIPTDKTLKYYYASGTRNPANSSGSFSLWTMPALRYANNLISASPSPEMFVSPYLQTPNEMGGCGQFSDEVAIVASSGSPRFQPINVVVGGTTEKWLLLNQEDNNGFAIRVAD
jgi:hypothetical protein